jgi:hypothetical protein
VLPNLFQASLEIRSASLEPIYVLLYGKSIARNLQAVWDTLCDVVLFFEAVAVTVTEVWFAALHKLADVEENSLHWRRIVSTSTFRTFETLWSRAEPDV